MLHWGASGAVGTVSARIPSNVNAVLRKSSRLPHLIGFSLFRMYLICDLRPLSGAEEPVIALTHSVISCEDSLPERRERLKMVLLVTGPVIVESPDGPLKKVFLSRPSEARISVDSWVLVCILPCSGLSRWVDGSWPELRTFIVESTALVKYRCRVPFVSGAAVGTILCAHTAIWMGEGGGGRKVNVKH